MCCTACCTVHEQNKIFCFPAIKNNFVTKIKHFSNKKKCFQVVTHKYGPDYGEVTDDAMTSLAHGVKTGTNLSGLGVKGEGGRGDEMFIGFSKKKKFFFSRPNRAIKLTVV